MNDTEVSPSLPDLTGGVRDVHWPLKHLNLAGLHWPSTTSDDKPPIVMLHGWLDNSLSFVRLAPELASLGHVYGVDLAGHGKSDHRPGNQGYPLVEYVADLAELLETHFSKPVDLVAHSLGGIVSVLYAAAFPENVRHLVMIDSLGPISREPGEIVGQLRKAIRKRMTGSGQHVVYPDLEAAAKARAGGLSPLSTEAAMALIPRNLRAVEGGFMWRTDPRLRHPSMMMFDEQQVLACLEAVTTRTLFIRAEDGLLAKRKGWERRLEAIKGLRDVSVPGSHHCHLDGDVVPVASAIRNFINDAG